VRQPDLRVIRGWRLGAGFHVPKPDRGEPSIPRVMKKVDGETIDLTDWVDRLCVRVVSVEMERLTTNQGPPRSRH
jgi:hypothetical protein